MREKVKIKKGLLLFIILILAILIFFLFVKENRNREKVSEVPGLYQISEVGDLSFEFSDAQMDIYPGPFDPSLPRTRHLFLDFLVENKGGEIKNVSNCGILLFEDGSQYQFKISQNDIDLSNQCDYYPLVPGGKRTITSVFSFIDPSLNLGRWENEPRNWESVPGLEINYFSQQPEGLVRFQFGKEEIVDVIVSPN